MFLQTIPGRFDIMIQGWPVLCGCPSRVWRTQPVDTKDRFLRISVNTDESAYAYYNNFWLLTPVAQWWRQRCTRTMRSYYIAYKGDQKSKERKNISKLVFNNVHTRCCCCCCFCCCCCWLEFGEHNNNNTYYAVWWRSCVYCVGVITYCRIVVATRSYMYHTTEAPAAGGGVSVVRLSCVIIYYCIISSRPLVDEGRLQKKKNPDEIRFTLLHGTSVVRRVLPN